jgi:hypothetical protein
MLPFVNQTAELFPEPGKVAGMEAPQAPQNVVGHTIY